MTDMTDMHQSIKPSGEPGSDLGKPRILFSTQLDGAALQHVLMDAGVLDQLAQHDYGLAMGMLDLSDERARVVRWLNERGVYTVAWMLLPLDEGCWFNLQNYPQALERYRAFREWVQHHKITFDAIGLDIEPPASEFVDLHHLRMRDIARRLWLSHENVLYPAARDAYTDMIAEIHEDGYEVHTYQIPLLADDRRAGTTLLQRSLDVIDLPADIEVLKCNSGLPLSTPGAHLQGALIASYGPSADSIGVGNVDGHTVGECADAPALALPWETLKRDLLLAARYTDTIYLFSLEGCLRRGLLAHIAALDWDSEPHVVRHKRFQVAMLRSVLLLVLLVARFHRVLLAWMGWAVALLLLARQMQQARAKKEKTLFTGRKKPDETVTGKN